MKASLKLCYLIVLLMSYLFDKAEGGDSLLTNGYVQYKGPENGRNEEHFAQPPCNCKQIQNTHEILEEILDRKLTPLRKMILELQDDVTTKLATVASSQNDLIRKVDEISQIRLLEVSTDIFRKISSKIDLTSKQDAILTTTDQISRRLGRLENDVQDNIIAKLDNTNVSALQCQSPAGEVANEMHINLTNQMNDRNNSDSQNEEPLSSSLDQKLISLESKLTTIESDTKNVLSKINSFTTNIHRLNNSADSACNENVILELLRNGPLKNISIELVNNLKPVSSNGYILKSIQEIQQKIVVLDKIPNLEENIKKIMNNGKQYDTNTIKPSANTTQQETNNGTVAPSDQTSFMSLCDALALSSVPAGDGWSYLKQTPADALDNFLVNKTGCRYTRVTYKVNSNYSILPEARAGAGREWRFAARGVFDVFLNVMWGERDGVEISIVQGSDTVLRSMPSWSEISRRSTANTAHDRYTPLAVDVRGGCLTFAVGCSAGAQQVFTHCDAGLGEGETVRVGLYPLAGADARMLHDCPSVTDHQTSFISLCDALALSSVPAGEDGWSYQEQPAADAFDNFLVNKTGCRYTLVKRILNNDYPLQPTALAGAGRERRAAVRSKFNIFLEVMWGEDVGIRIDIIYNGETVLRSMPSLRYISRHSTPLVLSEGHYAPFAVGVRGGCLTFTVGCSAGAQQVFTHCDASLGKGEVVRVGLPSWAAADAKMLHDCPSP